MPIIKASLLNFLEEFPDFDVKTPVEVEIDDVLKASEVIKSLISGVEVNVDSTCVCGSSSVHGKWMTPMVDDMTLRTYIDMCYNEHGIRERDFIINIVSKAAYGEFYPSDDDSNSTTTTESEDDDDDDDDKKSRDGDNDKTKDTHDKDRPSGSSGQQVAAKGLRVARSLFGALAEEGLEVSLKKTTWIASSPAVEAALKKQSKGEATQVSSVAKDLGVANAAGRARRTQVQAKRLCKGSTRGTRLQALRVRNVAHRVRVSKMGSLSAAIWGHQGMGLSPKQLRGLRSQAALAGRRQQLGSVDVVFSLGEGNCCDPLRTVILQHWRTLHKLLFAHPIPEQYQRLWKVTWTKLQTASKRWALVKGPVAAMVAYLQDLGVEASDATTWRFPAGSLQGPGLWHFERDTVLVTPGLSTVYRVEEALRRLLQHTANRRISQQDAGAGAACGIDWSVPRKLLRKQSKRPNRLTALRMVWQGAFFTTTKGAKRRCPLCQKQADLRHVLLECQWWRGRGPPPPPHWQKLRHKWPAESLWVRGLPPSSYTAFPSLSPDLLLPCKTGIWSPGTPVNAAHLVFGTDATGTTNDPRTRVVVAAVVACTLEEGQATEVGHHAGVTSRD